MFSFCTHKLSCYLAPDEIFIQSIEVLQKLHGELHGEASIGFIRMNIYGFMLPWLFWWTFAINRAYTCLYCRAGTVLTLWEPSENVLQKLCVSWVKFSNYFWNQGSKSNKVCFCWPETKTFLIMPLFVNLLLVQEFHCSHPTTASR